MPKMTKEEQEMVAGIRHYVSTGKIAANRTPKYSIVRLIYETIIAALMVLGLVIKHNLSKLIPALAAPKYFVRDKIVLLTGAGGGFGRRLAEQLVKRGAIVACVDVDRAANERCVNVANSAAAAAGRKDSTPAAYAFQANLAKREDTQKVVKEVQEKLGRVDILISAAMSFTSLDIVDFEDDEIDFLVDLYFKSNIWLIRAVLPEMRERNSGHIAVFSSLAGLFPAPNICLYSACKCALKGLMNSLYLDFQREKQNIGLTTIYPYFSPTSPIIRELSSHRLPYDLDPDEAVEEIINGIESKVLNLVLPRWMAPVGGIHGLLPKEALNVIANVIDFRVTRPGLLPKLTITVDKWTETYGAFRGPSGDFLTPHDKAEITPQMIDRSTELLKSLQEKIDQDGDVDETYLDFVRSLQSNASEENSV